MVFARSPPPRFRVPDCRSTDVIAVDGNLVCQGCGWVLQADHQFVADEGQSFWYLWQYPHSPGGCLRHAHFHILNREHPRWDRGNHISSFFSKYLAPSVEKTCGIKKCHATFPGWQSSVGRRIMRPAVPRIFFPPHIFSPHRFPRHFPHHPA